VLYGRYAARSANEGEVTVISTRMASRKALALVAAGFLAVGLTACASGWPTRDDPYESGQPSGNDNGPGTGSDEVVLLHLKPAS